MSPAPISGFAPPRDETAGAGVAAHRAATTRARVENDFDEGASAATTRSIFVLTRTVALVGIAYALLALLAYRPILPFDNSRLPTCACGDLVQNVWFLQWTSFAVLHGHNPFLTNYMNFPSVVNVAQNTSTPLLGIISAPVTWAFGPVASLNFLLWLAYPVSATACFVTLRRWVTWTPAAFVGGLLYGFSPYMVAQGVSHLNLIFVPIPPLILLALDELAVRQRRSARRVGIGLGLLAAAQYMISTEIFASTLVFAGFGVVLLMLLHRRQIRPRAAHALEALGWAVLVCGAIVGYPFYLALEGPNHLADVAAHVYSSSANLLSTVVPDANQRFAPSAWARLANQFAPGNLAENDGYLGIPLLVLLLAATIRYRRRGVVAFAGIMMLLAEILSLGPRLEVNSDVTSVPLLMADFDRLPIFSQFVDSRFALYADLFGAVILAISVDQLRRTLRDRAVERRLAAGDYQRPAPIRWPGVLMVGLLVLALIPLVPRWPSRSYGASLPLYFSTTSLERVPQGSIALTYPYPDYPNLSGMQWQAGTSMRFRIIGGYALVPGVGGNPIFRLFPPFLPSVPSTLVDDYVGSSVSAASAAKATPAQMRAFLLHYGVQTVFSEATGAHPKAADALFMSALGPPSTSVGRMKVWYDVTKRLVDQDSH
jgi:hypothetical protein